MIQCKISLLLVGVFHIDEKSPNYGMVWAGRDLAEAWDGAGLRVVGGEQGVQEQQILHRVIS